MKIVNEFGKNLRIKKKEGLEEDEEWIGSFDDKVSVNSDMDFSIDTDFILVTVFDTIDVAVSGEN